MTAAKARTLFARVAQEAPERWPAAVQTVLVGTLEILEQLVGAPAIDGEPSSPAAAPVAPPVDAAEAERRAGMSPEELEREALMDAAIAAAEAPAEAPPVQPQAKRGRKPAAPPQP